MKKTFAGFLVFRDFFVSILSISDVSTNRQLMRLGSRWQATVTIFTVNLFLLGWIFISGSLKASNPNLISGLLKWDRTLNCSPNNYCPSILKTVGQNILSASHQGFGLGHSENLCQTSPQLIQAIVLRHLLDSSSVSLDLSLFQDSNGFSVKDTLRLETLSLLADLVKPYLEFEDPSLDLDHILESKTLCCRCR